MNNNKIFKINRFLPNQTPNQMKILKNSHYKFSILQLLISKEYGEDTIRAKFYVIILK